MARPGARISESTASALEPKLRRIVTLLARAEARDWLATARSDDLPNNPDVPALPPGDMVRGSEVDAGSARAPEGGLPDRLVTHPAHHRTR